MNNIATFGFWMQTLANLDLLNLELQNLTDNYEINPFEKLVKFKGNEDFIRLRIAHLEKVNNINTLYTNFVDAFCDTNAYAFHNLYPYKGKFYPRIVRTLINAFKLNENSYLIDPFNGSGTTTHQASLMNIKSIGLDINPVGIMLSKLKNNLLFINENEFKFSQDDLCDIFNQLQNKQWDYNTSIMNQLMLILYFDTIDAFSRTTRFNKKGKVRLFIQKFNYIKQCYYKTIEIKDKFDLQFASAQISEIDVVGLINKDDIKNKFDACITSPPYYFSIDYVGKDKLVYDYLGIDMKQIKNQYFGMKSSNILFDKIQQYYNDLRIAIQNIYQLLKPGGNFAIIVGDSTVNNKKVQTTEMTQKFCCDIGFKLDKIIFNPLLGVRNRAIRGQSIMIFRKE